jgi:hypothetical protein
MSYPGKDGPAAGSSPRTWVYLWTDTGPDRGFNTALRRKEALVVTKSPTNSQVFLNEPTIEEARDAYLRRWHLQSVQQAWGGKKPTLAQFKKKFGAAYTKRQNWLAKNGVVAVIEEPTEDMAERVQAAVQATLRSLGIVSEPEPEVKNLGPLDKDAAIDKLATLLKQGKRANVADTNEEPKFVKPENFSELPRSGQVYFFLHRAVEAGLDYAVVPVKRGVAAEAISQIKTDGRLYVDVAEDLLEA